MVCRLRSGTAVLAFICTQGCAGRVGMGGRVGLKASRQASRECCDVTIAYSCAQHKGGSNGLHIQRQVVASTCTQKWADSRALSRQDRSEGRRHIECERRKDSKLPMSLG